MAFMDWWQTRRAQAAANTRRRTSTAQAAVAADVLETRQMLSAVSLTAEEQFMVELINRARANPTAELNRNAALTRSDERLSSDNPVTSLNQGVAASRRVTADAKQPLATVSRLAGTARQWSQTLINTDRFSHTDPQGNDQNDRLRDNGYPGGAFENLAYRQRPGGTLDREDIGELLHINLWNSPSHRPNILIDEFSGQQIREVGVGLAGGDFTFGTSASTADAEIATQLFGVNTSNTVYITGVVYEDSAGGADNDNFYSVGEGRGGGRVVATNLTTGEEFSSGVASAGGYNIEVGQGDAANGRYRVRLEQGGETYTLGGFTEIAGAQNSKRDFDLDRLNPDPPAPPEPEVDPDFEGQAVIRLDGTELRWSFYHEGEWYDASAQTGNPAAVDAKTGDFDGDGDLDVALQRGQTFNVYLLQGRDFVRRNGFVSFPGSSLGETHIGDFNGDGRDDIAGYDTATGEWKVAITDSNATGSSIGFVTWQALGQDRVWTNSRVGDFDGDGRDDIAVQESRFGQWYFMMAAPSNGQAGRFVTRSWGDSVNVDIQYTAIEAADVDGDGRDELLQLNSETGFWLVGFVFEEATFETWARWTTEAAWTNVLIGDFDGDGRDDIAAQTGTPTGNRDGVWYVATSELNGNVTPEQVRGRFVGQKWSDRWNPAWGVTQFGAADLDGDDRADLIGRPETAGPFLIGRSTGAAPADGGSGFDYAPLAGLLGDDAEIEVLLAGDRVHPRMPDLLADL